MAFKLLLAFLAATTAPAAPLITALSPVRQVLAPNDGLSLSVTATVAGSASYQWSHNNQVIPGATGATHSVSNTTAADGGWYNVVITDSADSSTTRSPTIFVTVAPATTQLYGWGDGSGGGEEIVPVEAQGDLAISVASNHALVLKRDGTVTAWGSNEYHQCDVPAGLNNAVAISAAFTFSMAVKSDGTLVSWGEFESPPDSDTIDHYHRSEIPAGLDNVVAVSVGRYHVLALKSDGSVWSWGDPNAPDPNFVSQAGVPAAAGSGVVAIAAGNYFSLALKADGTVIAWGQNSSGKATVPPGLGVVVAIAAGASHALALTSDGTVAAWGSDSVGQRTVPPGLSDVVSIAAGETHSFAVTSDRTVACWGQNNDHQSTVPSDLTAVTAVSGGEKFSLALRDASADTPPQATIGTPEFPPDYDEVDIPVTATGTPLLHYQWYVATPDQPTVFTALVDDVVNYYQVTTSMLWVTDPTAKAANIYLCRVFNGAGETMVGSVLDQWGLGTQVAVSTPENQTVPTGDDATFSVTGSGPGTLSYQWQVQQGWTGAWSDLANAGVYSGVQTDTLLITGCTVTNDHGDRFRCVVSNTTHTAVSSPARLTVDGIPTTFALGGATTFTFTGLPQGPTINATPVNATFTSIHSSAVDAGSYIATATATGEYSGTTSWLRWSITKATATLSLSGLSATYDGAAHAALAAQQGIVTTVAGTAGEFGDDNGVGTAAKFTLPTDVAVGPNGVLYVADTENHVIRKIAADGTVTTFAGTAGQEGTVDDTGSAARFSNPRALVVDSAGNVYVTGTDFAIRKITPSGVVTTIAGNPLGGVAAEQGTADGTGTAAQFTLPWDLAIDSSDNLYVADNHAIRKVTPAGVVTTLAGVVDNNGYADGTGSAARFYSPTGLAVDSSGNVYVSDTQNDVVRKITPGGTVTTLAGLAGNSGSTDGIGSAARFGHPRGIAVDSGGTLYVAELGQTIRKITTDGRVTTLAGSPGVSGDADGTGSTARFSNPFGLALDGSGSLFVADWLNHTIRRVSGVRGTITFTYDGSSTAPTAAGSYSVVATLSDSNYQGTASGTLVIAKAAQSSVPLIGSATSVTFGSSYTATSGSSGFGALEWALGSNSTASGAAIDAGTGAVTFTSFGTVVIKVRFAGDANHNPSAYSSDFTVTVNKAPVTFALSATSFTYNGSARVTVVNPTPSDATFTTGGTLTATNAGDYTATATATGNYTGSNNSLTWSITKASVTLALGGLSPTYTGSPLAASATQNAIVTTIAGKAVTGSADGVGGAAQFNTPEGLAFDASGTLYVADADNHLIRKIAPNGTVTTFAGGAGLRGWLDGTGTAARFNRPTGVVVDSTGNIFVVEATNGTIRKITSAGVVTTLAGNASAQGSSDGTGASARFKFPYAIAIDGAGDLYVADSGNHTIRKVTSAGVVTTLAGSAGLTGSADGTGNAARFNNPTGLVADSNGNVYVTDINNNTIRKITPAGVVTTLAGTAGTSGIVDGTGSAARFMNPHDLTIDGSGNLYVGDYAAIRRIAPDGTVSTVAGSADSGTTIDGNGPAARFGGVAALALDGSGNLLIGDAFNHTIRKMTPAADVTTVAGSGGAGAADGAAGNARFNYPRGLSLDASGSLYVADTSNNTIRVLAPDGTVSTLAGLAGNLGTDDGTGSAARFNGPHGVVVNSSGTVYVIDSFNCLIRRIAPGGAVDTLAGSAFSFSFADGTGAAAKFNVPLAIAGFDGSGNFHVFDSNSRAIRQVTPAGVVTTLAGGPGNMGLFSNAQGMAIDTAGNVYLADSNNGTIRKMATDYVVTTVAGLAHANAYVDGPVSTARFTQPVGLAVDASGNLFVADVSDHTIRKISTNGIVTTIAGLAGASGSSDGAGSAALFQRPQALAVDTAGTLYVSDTGNSTLRKIFGVGGTIAVTYNGSGTAPTAAGSYSVVATLTDPNFQGSTSGTLVIGAADQAAPVISSVSSVTFGSSYTAEADTGSGALEWALGSGSTASGAAIDAGTGAVSFTSFGTVVIKARFAGDSNHHPSAYSSDFTITVNKAPVTFALSTTSFTYNGSARVTTVNATPSDATFTTGGTLTATNAGDYIATATATGNYTGTNNSLTWSIAKATQIINLANLSGTYGGLAQGAVASRSVVTTFAGTVGSPGSLDGTGLAAMFHFPAKPVVDSAGNIYVADGGNAVIRKITPAGVVTTFAGSALQVGSIDGTGSLARFSNPQGLAIDGADNLYVADTGNCVIRRISPAGVVTTLAGSSGQFGAVDGTGAAARFRFPERLTVGSDGSIYVSDTGNHAVRKVSTAGVVTTLAGSLGSQGSVDGSGAVARFRSPRGIAVAGDGTLYVADTLNCIIRMISPAGTVTTIAGSALEAGSTDGVGSSARFRSPSDVALDSNGNLFIGDANVVRKIAPGNVVTTIAGQPNGEWDGSDGQALTIAFLGPLGVAVDQAGVIFVADGGSNQVRKISLAGMVTTLAGMPPSAGTTDGTGTSARFDGPWDAATDAAGNLYVANTFNHTIRKITPAGVVTTLAGEAGRPGWIDGTGTSARFWNPYGIVVSSAGDIYVADSSNRRIRKITPDGTVTTFAGSGSPGSSADGTGTAAQFTTPTGLAIDGADNLYLADRGNNTIRKITPAAVVTTIAGAPGTSGDADGVGSAARFNLPYGIAIDGAGNLYVSDTWNHTIRKILPDRTVSTLAGISGNAGWRDDVGTAAQFYWPVGLVVDASGYLYVAEMGNHTLRKIAPDGTVATLVGTPGRAAETDGIGGEAQFYYPTGLAFDGAGNLVATDWRGNTVRKVTGTSGMVSVTYDGSATAPTAPGSYSVAATLNDPNYQGSASGTLVIAKADQAAPVISSASSVTFGNAYTAAANTGSGALEWALGSGSIASGAAINSSNGAVTFTSFGTVVVKVRFAGDSNHNPSPYSADFTITVNKAPVTFALSASSFTYTGMAQGPTVNPTPGNATFTTGGTLSATNAGSYTATATATGNFTGTNNSLAWSITKATSGISLGNLSATYDGAAHGAQAALGVVTTYSGAAGGPGSLDGTGSSALFNYPQGAAIDSSGNIFIADYSNHTIRKVTPAGVVTTFAGTALAAGSADGIGSDARFYNPGALAFDGAGNLLVADTGNSTIRKITPAGVVTTFAGSAGMGGTTDGTGAAARFYGPEGIAVDGAGTIYVTDGSNQTIRKITPAGVVTTLAGSAGNSGTADGTGAAARFNYPRGLAVDAAGDLYVADCFNQTIRKVTSAGVVTTFAGQAGLTGSTNGFRTAARFQFPADVALDSAGNLYVADFNCIRKIATDGTVTTLAGNPNATWGSVDGTGLAARFRTPRALEVDGAGNIYVADAGNYQIRKVTAAGVVTTLAGVPSSEGSTNGPVASARFNMPRDAAFDASGNLYIADYGNHVIRKVSPAGTVSTFAGSVGQNGSTDGTGSAARFTYPTGIATNSAGDVFVSEENSHTIRKITPAGVVTTFAGSSGVSGSADDLDGSGNDARFYHPGGLAVDGAGNLYVADIWNRTIRKITPAGVVTTLAGSVQVTGHADGIGSAAVFGGPIGIVWDGGGYLYVTDAGGLNYIRKVAIADGTVTTVAGGGNGVGSDDGVGSSARFSGPFGIAISTSGYLYVTEVDYLSRIRRIAPDGTVTTVAGSSQRAEVDGIGTNARFYYPTGIAINGAGALFITDFLGNTIRKISGTSGVVTVTYNGSTTPPATVGSYTVVATLDDPNYQASATDTLVVAQASQAAPVISSGAAVTFGNSYTATANTGFGAPQWALGTGSTASGAAINASTGVVTFTSTGTVVIKVRFAGDSNHNPSAYTSDFTIAINALPAVTVHPASQTSGSGQSVQFSVTATGTPAPTYQWQMGSGSTWQNLTEGDPYSGTNTATLTIAGWAASTLNGIQFRCIVTNAVGSATTNAATLTVRVLGADFNGDGKSDLVWTNQATGDRYLQAMNAGGYLGAKIPLTNLTADWQAAGSGDFNGDGKSDILWLNTVSGACYVWFMDGASYIGYAYITTMTSEWRLAGSGDFNGDGKSDILWHNTATGACYVWLMNGTSYVSNAYITTMATEWRLAGAGDFNADGKADILWQNTQTGDCYVWFMNGTTYSSNAHLGTRATVWRIVGTDDYNGDGQSDLAWSHAITGERELWLMNGASQSGTVSLGITDRQWVLGWGQPPPATTRTPADFNADGKSDILWQNTQTGDCYVWYMNGTSYSSYAYLTTLPLEWRLAGTGDFNGDGKGDIFWQNTTDGSCYVWYMNGATYSGNAYVTTMAADWRLASTGDFNGDGKTDLVWRNTTSGDYYIWLMDGTSYTAYGHLTTLTADWRLASTGDFNNDGKADILWQNTQTGVCYVWYMDGLTYSSYAPLTTMATNWRLAGSGDFNGDGKADIVWRDLSSGYTYVWLMNGTTLSSYSYLSAMPVPPWHLANGNKD